MEVAGEHGTTYNCAVRSFEGVTLIELLIVVAIVGVLMGIAALSIHPDRIAVNQAATGLANSVARARFEALKENTNAGLQFSMTGSGSYLVCLDQNLDGACDATQTLSTVSFGTGDNSRVRLTNATSPTVMFDRRGIALTAGSTVTLSNRSGSYNRNVVILATGKAEVQ